eukprot:353206-Chlamydomonas_euryale.AAC.15
MHAGGMHRPYPGALGASRSGLPFVRFGRHPAERPFHFRCVLMSDLRTSARVSPSSAATARGTDTPVNAPATIPTASRSRRSGGHGAAARRNRGARRHGQAATAVRLIAYRSTLAGHGSSGEERRHGGDGGDRNGGGAQSLSPGSAAAYSGKGAFRVGRRGADGAGRGGGVGMPASGCQVVCTKGKRDGVDCAITV